MIFNVFIYFIFIRLKYICKGNVMNFFNYGDLIKIIFMSFDVVFRKYLVKRDGKWF